MELTPKQEKFCRSYVETGNASEAYRRAYNIENSNPDSIRVNACKMLANPKMATRIQELRIPIMQRHNITIDSLLAELEEARLTALSAETPQSSAAVSATMGKAKLCGLDKQIIEHRGNADQPLVIELTPSEN